MAKPDVLIPFIKRWEGGFVNDPIDRGGATNMGITFRTLQHYRRQHHLPPPRLEDLKRLSEEEWRAVFKDLFWDRWQADKIQSQAVANILVDWVWASGSFGIRIPQKMLGVRVDGMVGAETLKALNAQDPERFAEALLRERHRFIEGIVERSIARYERKLGRRSTPTEQLRFTQKRFLKGWKRRIDALQQLH